MKIKNSYFTTFKDNKRIKKFSSVYQISTYKVQAEILTDYLIKNKINERIVILHDAKEELAAYLINL